ncbi:hypothetical protein RAS1_31800 [Phycisphaerae bacterium RAS1]|nr:hypothetical protein RAS1_31800 [Phycisphaerae bacterium RAS1]
MATMPEDGGTQPTGETPAPSAAPDHAAPAAPPAAAPAKPRKEFHEVNFVTYPKLLFTWPLILMGFLLWPLSSPDVTPPAETPAVASPTTAAAPAESPAAARPAPVHSDRQEVLAWIYVWTAIIVLMTLGVDLDRNAFVFWLILVALIGVGGLWLRERHGFTLLGDIYKWFAHLDLQYSRKFGLTISIQLSVPFAIMSAWAHFNDKWRITHNEFEHYSFGRSDDTLGRGAKSIRTSFPDVLEFLLGLAGTLVVSNASGTRELRRIPHVMFLPMVRKRLNSILERTAVTTTSEDDEEEEETA